MPYARSGSWRIKKPPREDLPNERFFERADTKRRANIGHCREHDVTELVVYCTNYSAYCFHGNRLPISGMPDDLMLDDIQGRCRCTKCGKKGADVRPHYVFVSTKK